MGAAVVLSEPDAIHVVKEEQEMALKTSLTRGKCFHFTPTWLWQELS